MSGEGCSRSVSLNARHPKLPLFFGWITTSNPPYPQSGRSQRSPRQFQGFSDDADLQSELTVFLELNCWIGELS